MSDRDVDAQFADIIAHWDDVAPLPERGPDAPQTNEPPADLLAGGAEHEDGGPADDDPAGNAQASPVPPVRPSPVNPSPLTGSIPVWRGATSTPPAAGGTGADVRAGAGAGAGEHDRDDARDRDDEDEHFQPGPTAPLPPQEDIHFWGIVVGLVAGPLLLLWLVIVRPDVSNWWVLASLGLTVMGFVLLVLRQPHTRDDDDHDDGARV